MTSLGKKASDNKQEVVILEEWIWMTYFLNSSVAVAEAEDNNSFNSISEDLVVIMEAILVINNSSNKLKTFLKIQT